MKRSLSSFLILFAVLFLSGSSVCFSAARSRTAVVTESFVESFAELSRGQPAVAASELLYHVAFESKSPMTVLRKSIIPRLPKRVAHGKTPTQLDDWVRAFKPLENDALKDSHPWLYADLCTYCKASQDLREATDKVKSLQERYSKDQSNKRLRKEFQVAKNDLVSQQRSAILADMLARESERPVVKVLVGGVRTIPTVGGAPLKIKLSDRGWLTMNTDSDFDPHVVFDLGEAFVGDHEMLKMLMGHVSDVKFERVPILLDDEYKSVFKSQLSGSRDDFKKANGRGLDMSERAVTFSNLKSLFQERGRVVIETSVLSQESSIQNLLYALRERFSGHGYEFVSQGVQPYYNFFEGQIHFNLPKG